MKSNMSNIDKVIRLIVVAAIIALYFMGSISGTTAIILGVLATVFLLTSMVSFCPLYSVFGISTRGGGES